MTGSACRSTFRYKLRWTFHRRKKEMILRRIGGGFGRGKGSALRSDAASADDGKRLSRYELRWTFHHCKKEMILRRLGGGFGRGKGSGFTSNAASADYGKRFGEVRAALDVSGEMLRA